MLGPEKVPVKKFRDTLIDPKSYEGRSQIHENENKK